MAVRLVAVLRWRKILVVSFVTLVLVSQLGGMRVGLTSRPVISTVLRLALVPGGAV